MYFLLSAVALRAGYDGAGTPGCGDGARGAARGHLGGGRREDIEKI